MDRDGGAAAMRLGERPCPVCGHEQGSVRHDARVDLDRLDEFAFASRKEPEHMHWRLLECPRCDTLYANPAPTADVLHEAYAGADFDSGLEARYAARTYAGVVEELARSLPDRRGALDIGTGEGALLRELLRLGFTDVAGVEPSAAPIRAAEPDVAPLIREEMFDAARHAAGSLSLVTCCQTIEHVPAPLALCRGAAGLLRPGGALLLVCHDRRAPVNRLLGMRSPIIDVEHLQLLSPASVRALLERAGLVDVTVRPIRNRYPVAYWVRLLPLPAAAKGRFQEGLRAAGLARRPLTLPTGNLAAWGVRPA